MQETIKPFELTVATVSLLVRVDGGLEPLHQGTLKLQL